MGLQEIREVLEPQLQGQIRLGEDLKKHTTWGIGGPADLLVLPASLEDMQKSLQVAHKYNIPVTVLGNGSNVLVADDGIRGLVIKTIPFLQSVEIKGTEVYAYAGALLPSVSRLTGAKGLSGLEFATGIPASIGGAAAMNAGAHGVSISQVITEVDALKSDGTKLRVPKEQAGFGYRSSRFQKENLIITGVKMQLGKAEGAQSKELLNKLLEERREAQPGGANAGSVFRNPANGPAAGFLLDKVGCKGLSVGDAVVSEKHANFIINRGNATAADVCALIRLMREKVAKECGIELETEIKFLGA